ncbi:MAG: ASCH domain-containing protein [Ruminococcaceae bacterium]|nr:ASCH domain-containing protein [Oscillospiraceae bacterium]
MKSVLISIQPQWCELIASGKKTVEVRKTKPKLDTPFKCYIYEAKGKKQYFSQPLPIPYNEGRGKVIGEFVCDEIKRIHCQSIEKEAIYAIAVGNGDKEYYDNSCVSYKEAYRYLRNVKKAYGWHISDLVIYDKPKELSELKKINRECWYADLGLAKRDCPECQNKGCFVQRPPQSWCYVEGGGSE